MLGSAGRNREIRSGSCGKGESGYAEELMDSFRDVALVLAGHGSTLNADSSAPTYRHADELRRRRIFREVHECFWKEEPHFRDGLRQVESEVVCIVPLFISNGYFTETVLPREFGLKGPRTLRDGLDIRYCDPVGTHPEMTGVLLHRAREVLKGEEIDPADTCLFIAGHGTSLNDNSVTIIREQAARIADMGLYGECQAFFMEQEPFVRDWARLTEKRNVIVVPFFIADGLHSYEDIPEMLGISKNVREQGFSNPTEREERRLWYASAIGTEPLMADVILAQVASAWDRVGPGGKRKRETGRSPSLWFREWLSRAPSGSWSVGQVSIFPSKATVQDGGAGYLLCHVEDSEGVGLQSLPSLAVAREHLRYDDAGNYRPLKGEGNLRRGWRLGPLSFSELLAALEMIYPTAVADAAYNEEGSLPVTPYAETAARQTGMYRLVRHLSDGQREEVCDALCRARCLKSRLWKGEGPSPPSSTQLPLLCPEACNLFIAAAREKMKQDGRATSTVESS